MIEKITNLAEKVATNISTSRRGFLGRVAQAALGVIGVVGGLLALPAEAKAATYHGYCRVIPRVPPLRGRRGSPAHTDGQCVAGDNNWCVVSGQILGCPINARPLALQSSTCDYNCQFGTCAGIDYDSRRPCTFNQ